MCNKPDAPEDTVSARLEPGQNAPDFTLPTDDGSAVTLSELRGRRVIVYFYPAAMTPGCTKQACDFSDSLASLRGEGFEVLGISPDKPEKLAKFRERDALSITLLSDADRAVMEAWGAFGGEEALRQGRPGRHPLHRRRRRRGSRRARAVQRELPAVLLTARRPAPVCSRRCHISGTWVCHAHLEHAELR